MFKIGDAVQVYRPLDGDTAAVIAKHVWKQVWEVRSKRGNLWLMHEENMTKV